MATHKTRLAKIEAQVERQTASKPLDIIRVIVGYGRSVMGASRRGKDGRRIQVTEAELADIRLQHEKP